MLLANFLGSVASSIAKKAMAPTLIEDFKKGVFFLIDKYKAIKNERKYEEYVLIQELKWFIIIQS